VHIASSRKTIEPPADLKPQAAEIFREMVASCAANHFRKSDIPILTAFATATHLSRFYAERIGESEGAFKAWEAAARLHLSGDQTADHAAITIRPQDHRTARALRPNPPWEIRALQAAD
jgi:hypothetical protein